MLPPHLFRVNQRTGESFQTCGVLIKRIVVGQRGPAPDATCHWLQTVVFTAPHSYPGPAPRPTPQMTPQLIVSQ